MSQPVTGTTTFDDVPDGTVLAAGSAAGGLIASDVDGWDIDLGSSDSTPDSQIIAESSLFVSSGETIDGWSGEVIGILAVWANNADLFTLESVDVGVADISADVSLVGYREGVLLGGQTLSLNADGTMTTFDVAGNSAFQNIDKFVIFPSGPSVVGLDNIDAQGFVVARPVVTTDGGSAGFTAGNNTVSTPVAVDSGLTLTDASSSTLQSATVSITGNFHSGDELLFVNDGATMGNVTGSYNGSSGVLTLSSAGAPATLAQFQAALRSVSYTDVNVTPNPATRTISFAAHDGTTSSLVATRTVTVTDTDQTPIVTTSASTLSYVSGSPAAVIDAGVIVSDRDNTTLAAGTVSIGSGFQTGDVLGFSNTNSIVYGDILGSYNAGAGMLSLTSASGTATLAQWQAALDSVTFSSTTVTPGSRRLAFTINDGIENNSLPASDTITVSVPPSVTTDSGSAAFVAGNNTASTPVVVDGGLTLSDASSSTLASATVSITGNFHSGEDVLEFVSNPATMGDVTGSYNALTGVLTLSSLGGAVTLAQLQAALRSVTYTDTAVTPNGATRTISFTANDGTNSSAVATRPVTVTDTDQRPIVTTSASTLNYLTGSPAAVIDAGVTVSDRDNTFLESGTVSIGSGFQAGDMITFNPAISSDILGFYSPATGELALFSPAATLAQWQAALDSVTFSTSGGPGGRSIQFVVNDGTQSSAAGIDSVSVGIRPTVTTDPGAAVFAAGDNVASTPVAIDSGLTLSDAASATLASATVSITGNFQPGEDVLGFVNDGTTMGNVTGSYDAATGVLTLSSAGATATLAQFQAALDSVTYTDTAVTPNPAARTISLTVNDGTNSSPVVTRTVTVTDTDQTPVVGGPGQTLSYLSNAAPAAIGGLTVSDLDNATLASGTVSIGSGFQPGDVLGFSNTSNTTYGSLTGAYDAGTGVLTLSSAGPAATLAQWQAALDAITFASTSEVAGSRSVAFTVSDGSQSSAAASKTVQVVGSTASGNTVAITAAATVSNTLTLPPGPVLVGGPAGSPAALTLLAGGTLTSGGAPTGTSGITLGGAAGTVGTVAVTGAALDANGTRLTIGDAGGGTLTVSGGRTARAGASYADSEAALALGATAGGTGMLTVSGPGSQLVANGAAVIGGTNAGGGVVAGGTGSVVVSNGGQLQTGAMTVEAGSSVTVDQASTLAATSLTLQGGTADVYALPAATAVSFGPGGSLVVHAVSGAASASGFTFGDSLDLAGVTGQSGLQSTVSVGSGTLSVNTAAGVTSYLSDDGNGGTLVTPTSTSVTIYRFFESGVGIEFLTTSAGEAATIQQTQPGYVYEGASSDLAALTPDNGDPNAVQVYRFFDTDDGSHFYTTSATERDALISTRPDMTYESGSVFYEHLTRSRAMLRSTGSSTRATAAISTPTARRRMRACWHRGRIWRPRGSPSTRRRTLP